MVFDGEPLIAMPLPKRAFGLAVTLTFWPHYVISSFCAQLCQSCKDGEIQAVCKIC